jgi:hypothetical protein
MIRLQQLLREFQYGDRLWADQDIWKNASPSLKNVLKRLYPGLTARGPWEPNTEDEQYAWAGLNSYVIYDTKSQYFTELLEDLLRIKSRFPSILDPGLSSTTKVYRGMQADTQYILDAIRTSSSTPELVSDIRSGLADTIRIATNFRMINSRSSDFISMTTRANIAADFANAHDVSESKWPIVAEVQYGDIERRALMNPKFMDSLTSMAESEFFFIGNRMPIIGLYIPDPEKWQSEYANDSFFTKIKNALRRAGTYGS